MITLHELAGSNPAHRFSPFCWRSRLALAHKGLQYETRPWRFGELPRLASSTGSGLVPVLDDDGEIVLDSTRIAFYLESRYPTGPSLFTDAHGHALTRFAIHWADTVLLLGMLRLVGPDIERFLAETDRPGFRAKREQLLGCSFDEARAGRDEALPRFRERLGPLRAVVGMQDFLGGEEPSYADHAVFGGFQWARCVSEFELLDEADPVWRWRERMLDLFDEMARRAVTWRDA